MAERTGPRPDVPCSTGCGAMLRYDRRRKGTKCRPCLDKERTNPPRFCSECGKPISRRANRETTLCRSHAAKSAARREKLAASMRERHRDPHYQTTRSAAMRLAQQERHRDPVKRAAAQEAMRAVGKRFGGSAHRDQGPISRKSRNTRLADIPLAYRDEYVQLGITTRIPAAERKSIILAEAAAAVRRHHKQQDQS